MKTTSTRGHRFWELTSAVHDRMDRLPTARRVNSLMVTNTGIRPGDTVLDLGCGAGAYLAALRDAVGQQGRVVGIDHGESNVRRARRRIAKNGWTNVEAHLGDATRTLPDLEFDAAVALYSLSAMPDMAAATRLVHEALAPGGHCFVADVRFVPSGRADGVLRLLRTAIRRLAGGTGEDVVPHMREVFTSVQLLDGRGGTLDEVPPWPPLVMLVTTKGHESHSPEGAADPSGVGSSSER